MYCPSPPFGSGPEMAMRQYGVIDADGFKINTIVIDDAAAPVYWPGYGAKMIDEGAVPEDPKPAPPPPKPDDFGLLDFKLDKPMRVGDQIDFKTGVVTEKKDDVAAVDAQAEPLTP